nr:5971_t:CDS:2 [Entrophospora candida]
MTTTGSEKGQRLARATYPTFYRNRLPTLQEVLTRKTAPPVCLYNYYLYMRDREHASEYLDFYLDVLEHEIVCKAYVKDIKKHGMDVNTIYPDYEKYQPDSLKKKEKDKRFSTTSSDVIGIKRNLSGSSKVSIDIPPNEKQTTTTNDAKLKMRDSIRSNKTNTTGNFSILSRDRPFTRDDLRDSAERIFFKYINQGSEKQLMVLSDHVREKITHAIDEESDTKYKRDDPWIFHEAKKEIYSYMEREHFPRFLQARAFSNMNITHIMLRLVIGLVCLLIGFAVALSLIFLDIKPNAVRLWSFIPIFLGVLNIIVNQTELSPLFVLLKISETTLFKFQKIQEPYIYQLHIKKGIQVFCASLIISIIVTLIFVAVPGHRL